MKTQRAQSKAGSFGARKTDSVNSSDPGSVHSVNTSIRRTFVTEAKEFGKRAQSKAGGFGSRTDDSVNTSIRRNFVTEGTEMKPHLR